MTGITSKINAHVYIKNREHFLIPLIENWYADNEVIFQDNNLSCHFHKKYCIKLQESINERIKAVIKAQRKESS